MMVNTTHNPSMYITNTNKTSALAETGDALKPDDKNNDTVTLSKASIDAANAEKTLPFEYYQLPDWYAAYGAELSGQLGATGGSLDTQYPGTMTASTPEREEFGKRINGHYQAILEAANVVTTEDHYNATIRDTVLSEQLHQQMTERVKNDPRLIDIMEKFGIEVS